MRLYNEIFKSAEGAALSRCIIVPNGGGYFEGVKAVETFSPEQIVLCLTRGRVEINGARLLIKKYLDGDMEISGEISSLRTIGKGGDV